MASDVLVLGIDQSTQGTKALLFDVNGALVDKIAIPHRQIINDKGYVEHDLNEISKNVIDCVRQLVSRDPTRAERISTVGISVQRETVAAWRRSSLKPLYNAIVWQCPRGAEFVSRPEVQSMASRIRTITGLELSEYFSAAKITWMVDHVDEVAKAISEHDICIGNMDAFVISYLTHGEVFATEPSNASRTQLLDIEKVEWSDELCRLFKVPKEALPPIKDSDSLFGYTDFEGVLKNKIAIHCALGDSMGALFGHGCLKSGQLKATYGTGSSIMMNVGDKPGTPKKGIVNSIGWRRQGRTAYALEGNINYSAGIISYLKDDLKLISSPAETEQMAKDANPSDHCFFVPALSGLGAPYFNGNVRGTILGMSRVTGRNEVVRAALDSIALQINDILTLVKESSPVPISNLHVDGGATKNAYLMQMQSDLANLPVVVPAQSELSGMGVAYMAAIAEGIYDESVLQKEADSTVYAPREDKRTFCEELTEGWHKAVKAAIAFGS